VACIDTMVYAITCMSLQLLARHMIGHKSMLE